MLRFEAWSTPWDSAGFARRIADIPVINGKGTIRFNDFGEGSIDVPADYTRLDEIISGTVGSLIRVYDGSTVIQEFLAERVERSQDDTTATISGGDLATVFDKAVVYPYDYPTNIFPDHIWDGQDILQNGGFETPGQRGTILELYNDASSGTFTLSDGTDTTSAIAYNASAFTVETRLEADISSYDDVNVTGSGTESDPWVLEFVDPIIYSTINLSVDDTGLTGGTSTLSVDTYGALEPTGWTKSQVVSSGTPRVFGEYDSFVISTSQTHAGTYSLYIDPATIGRRYAGAQQIVNVKPGNTYQASVWVYTGGSSQQYRLVIRGIDEDYIASVQSTPSASTWTELSIADVVIPDGTTQIIFRIANINPSGDPDGFYVDDAGFNEGQAAATIGTIVSSLMDDAASDHSGDTRGTILDWVDYTGFSTSVDSSADTWDDSLSFTASRGMSYGQVFDKLVDLGYEWNLTPKASPGATTHDLNWYNAGNLGTDYTTSASPAVNSGQSVTGGPVVQRIPEYTAVLMEGAAQSFLEDSDTTALTNFGRLEKYQGDTALASTTSLTAAGDALLAEEAANRVAVQVDIVRNPDHPIPGVSYTVGDTLYFQIVPTLTQTARQIHQISWRYGEPPTYKVTGSKIFTGDAGGWEAIRRILRRFTPIKDDQPTPAASFVGSGGGMAHVLIVSDSEPAQIQAKADYVVTSSPASAPLQAVFDALETQMGNNGSWSIWMAGIFDIDSDVTAPGNSWIRGLGYYAASGGCS